MAFVWEGQPWKKGWFCFTVMIKHRSYWLNPVRLNCDKSNWDEIVMIRGRGVFLEPFWWRGSDEIAQMDKTTWQLELANHFVNEGLILETLLASSWFHTIDFLSFSRLVSTRLETRHGSTIKTGWQCLVQHETKSRRRANYQNSAATVLHTYYWLACIDEKFFKFLPNLPYVRAFSWPSDSIISLGQ